MVKDTVSRTTLHRRHTIKGIKHQARRMHSHMLSINQLPILLLKSPLHLLYPNGNQLHLQMVRFTITTNELVRLSGKSRWECHKEVWSWFRDLLLALVNCPCLLVGCVCRYVYKFSWRKLWCLSKYAGDDIDDDDDDCRVDVLLLLFSLSLSSIVRCCCHVVRAWWSSVLFYLILSILSSCIVREQQLISSLLASDSHV